MFSHKSFYVIQCCSDFFNQALMSGCITFIKRAQLGLDDWAGLGWMMPENVIKAAHMYSWFLFH